MSIRTQQNIYDEGLITSMIVGGSVDSTVSVEWTEGGGEDISRWVTLADSASFECRMFSFDTQQRKVTARLFRAAPGTYEVRLTEDLGGVSGRALFTGDFTLNRFDTFSVLVPPGKPVMLSARLVKPDPAGRQLPDLAIAGYDCIRAKTPSGCACRTLAALPPSSPPCASTTLRTAGWASRSFLKFPLPWISWKNRSG